MKTEDDDNKLIGIIFCLLSLILGLVIGFSINISKVEETEEIKEEIAEIVYAYTTAYNTLAYQTDNTPCVAANGADICGRNNVVACPRYLPLGTWIKIDGKLYECADRTNTKYDGRFDISFDKDLQGALAYGIQLKEVAIIR